MCQAGPRYPHEDHHEAVACTGWETSDGLIRWRGEMEGGRMMKDGNQRDLRGIQTYPICDVSLLWVSWIIIMRLHADCTVLHLWGSKRIKALDVFCGWPWREVLGCVTAAFSSSLSSAFPTPRLCIPAFAPMTHGRKQVCRAAELGKHLTPMPSVSAAQPNLNFRQQEPSTRFRKELLDWIVVGAKSRLNS